MQLARVTGTVVASTKVPGLEGVKLLMIQPLDRQQRPKGSPVVAADAVHMAGPGELVYFVACARGGPGAAGDVRARRPRHRRHRRRGDRRCPSAEGELVKLARVVGNVVSTINTPGLRGPHAAARATCSTRMAQPAGGYQIAVDDIGAGAGETVLLLDEGNGARQVLERPGRAHPHRGHRHRRRGHHASES